MIEKCPRCENENIKEDYKYCPICGIKLETAQEVPVQEQLTKKDIECIYRHLQMFIKRENKCNVPDACEVCNSYCVNEEHILNQWDSFDKLSNLIIQYGLEGEPK